MIDKQFITLPLSELIPYENNPRINDDAVKDVVTSIKQCENIDPIEIDESNVILSGHTRLKALTQLGYIEVECLRITGLTEEQKRKYRILANKTGERAEWDFSKLEVELKDLDFEGYDFEFDGIEFNDGSDFFERKNRSDTSREEGNDAYNEFLEKFEPKKTTDDCYTPERVYNAVVDWVCKEYGKNKEQFVRPFYPGGDYRGFTYPEGCVVVDNPPFSILSEILKFYAENRIDFFLFGPTLTLFSSSSSSSCSCAICIGASVTYENGANVDTSFLTSLEKDCRLRSAPDLYKAVSEANKANLKDMKIELPKFSYCDYIITSTRCSQFSKHGIDFRVPLSESAHIRQLDAQKESGKAIYGSGYLLSERLKVEKEKAEREKAEREKAEREKAEREKAEREKEKRWELSDREMEIVKSLN